MFLKSLYKINYAERQSIQQIVINVKTEVQINYLLEIFDITAQEMDKKLYNLIEAVDFVQGDESEVEELLSDSDFKEDVLDLVPAKALGNQSYSDEKENLPLQELEKNREEKKDNTGTDNEQDGAENPTQTPAAPTVPIYKQRKKDTLYFNKSFVELELTPDPHEILTPY